MSLAVRNLHESDLLEVTMDCSESRNVMSSAGSLVCTKVIQPDEVEVLVSLPIFTSMVWAPDACTLRPADNSYSFAP